MKRLVLVLLCIAALAPAGARADHIESILGPAEPVSRDFPEDFLPLLPVDRQAEIQMFPQWNDKHVGGWGGQKANQPSGCPANHVQRRPVIFVHGTTVDAEFWRASDSADGTIVNVRSRYLAAGYCAHELWAISYDGAPGYFTYNDINTKEVYLFIRAVRTYLATNGIDASKIDVVSHSLGVTVVRKAAYDHPDLASWIENYIAIAGANHGTTTCRGVGTARGNHVCEEIEPGSAWLAQINGPDGAGEQLGSSSLTIYSGANADNFYLGPDVESPRLKHATCNRDMGAMAHNTLARGDLAVKVQLAFLGGAECGALP